ncbi:methyl-accepting chemotaxis protein [Caulobacter sp. KR2-114]|uniref:methyl-accepting chemotaxis protein n=1 Tax=Caulobacter sp. KR2-114 TaxID=3400912 RepID=UPI003C056007
MERGRKGAAGPIERLVAGALIGLVLASAGGAALNATLAARIDAQRAAQRRAAAAEQTSLRALIARQKQVEIDVIQVQQFLTDVSATRGQSGLDDGWGEAERYAAAFRRDSAEARRLATALGAQPLAAALDGVAGRFDGYYTAGQTMAHAYVTGGPEAGNAIMPTFDKEAEAMTTAVGAAEAAVDAAAAQAAQREAARDAALARQETISLAVTVAAAVVAAGAALWVAAMLRRRVIRPLARLSDYMTVLADGRYDEAVPQVGGRDELGAMTRAIAVFREAAIERRDTRLAREREQAADLAAQAERDAERQARDAERRQVVDALAQGLHRLAEGDVAFRVEAELAADYRVLQTDFNAASARLQSVLWRVDDASSAVGRGAAEIATAADELARRTERQAASLEETAAALDQITATVRQTADSAGQARKVVDATYGDGAQTETVLGSALEAVGEIEASSSQIGQIVGVIDEIAFQTNLLALNAGVEAARAGEAGRGFAVVASEVRALAQRSAEAAKEIKGLIGASSQKVAHGVAMVGETEQALKRILQRVQEMAQIVTSISLSAQEQARALAEVNAAVNDMDRVTQQNAAMVEQTTAAAHALKGQYGLLSQEVANFALGDRPPVAARVRAA